MCAVGAGFSTEWELGISCSHRCKPGGRSFTAIGYAANWHYRAVHKWHLPQAKCALLWKKKNMTVAHACMAVACFAFEMKGQSNSPRMQVTLSAPPHAGIKARVSISAQTPPAGGHAPAAHPRNRNAPSRRPAGEKVRHPMGLIG